MIWSLIPSLYVLSMYYYFLFYDVNLLPSSSPAVIIQLVKHCHNLRSLSLLGYEELSDIVLEFISGEHEDSPGLSRLESITLPDKSFLTPEGVRSLLRHLPLLHTVNFPGKNKQ